MALFSVLKIKVWFISTHSEQQRSVFSLPPIENERINKHPCNMISILKINLYSHHVTFLFLFCPRLKLRCDVCVNSLCVSVCVCVSVIDVPHNRCDEQEGFVYFHCECVCQLSELHLSSRAFLFFPVVYKWICCTCCVHLHLQPSAPVSSEQLC